MRRLENLSYCRYKAQNFRKVRRKLPHALRGTEVNVNLLPCRVTPLLRAITLTLFPATQTSVRLNDSCNDLFRRAAWFEFGGVHAFLAPYVP